MAFPANASDLEVCIAYGANLASDLTTLTYSGNLATTLVQPRVLITRGRIGGASRTQPTTIDLGLKNPNGVFSPRNITGPNYGRLRRNTPVRVRLDPGTGMVTRGIAYMPDWPIRWTGPDIDDHIPMQASGALRRLGAGQDAKSALRRSILAPSPAPLAYWRMEDANGATSAASSISGGLPLTVLSGTVSFGAFSDLPGAERAPDLTASGRLIGPVQGASATAWTVEFAAKCAVNPTANPIQILTTGGSQSSFWFNCQATPTSGGVQLVGQTSPTVFVNVVTAPVLTNYDGVWHHYRLTMRQVGAEIYADLYVDGVLATFFPGFVATLGTVTGVIVNSARGGTTVAGSVAHVAYYDYAMTTDHSGATSGYSGELAATRVARLCAEDGVTVNVTSGFTEPMGPQLPGTLPDLLRECEDSDAATLIERRTGVLGFDPIGSRYNVSVVMTIPYLSVADLQPDEGDRDLRNYVTVQRIGGSSATNQRVVGPLGTDPATGVDRYPDTVSRSLALDSQAPHHASWITKISTVDEPRYVIELNLRAHPEMVTQWLACDIGSRIQVTSPPAGQVGPAPVDVIIEGYEEMLDGVEWYVVIYALPYRPYEVIQIQSGTGNRSRIAAGTSTTDLAYSATATSLSVTSATTVWIDSATYPSKFPILIEIAGEVMTCTAIANWLNSNPYFEANASGWTGKGGTFVRSTAQFHEGAASGLLTPTGVAATSEIESDPVSVVPGGTLRLTPWVRCAVARNINLNINWSSSSGYLSTSSAAPVAVLANTWTQLDFTATAPATAASGTGLVSMTGTPPATNLLNVDEALMTAPLRQTFAVTRGLHGVSKALPITSQVQVWRAAAISL